MYIASISPGDRRMVHAIITVDRQPFRANLYTDIDKFWRLHLEPFVRGPEADRAKARFFRVLDQDGWDSLKDSHRLVEQAIRRTGSDWSGWEAEGNEAGGGRQVGALSQDKPAPQPLVTVVEGGALSAGAAIALMAGMMMREGSLRSFLMAIGGSVAGSAVFSIIKRKASETP